MVAAKHLPGFILFFIWFRHFDLFSSCRDGPEIGESLPWAWQIEFSEFLGQFHRFNNHSLALIVITNLKIEQHLVNW